MIRYSNGHASISRTFIQLKIIVFFLLTE
jgi:hypothetical protein